MKQTRESKKAPSAESIARMADRGEDVSRFFTNRGKMMRPDTGPAPLGAERAESQTAS
jgi:hypothetical protein